MAICIPRTFGSFQRWGFFVALSLLLPALALVYGPSLNHMPRSDQLDFLANTIGEDDFATLAAHTWSYNRISRLASGDGQLFRPALFLLLSLEKAWFGANFVAWQALNLLLHVVVCCLFLRLLNQVFALIPFPGNSVWSPAGLLPYALTCFFALNIGVVEQAIYHHLAGYLLFVVLVLGSLTLVLDVVRAPDRGGWSRRLRLGAAWLLILLAAFTYELGQLYGIMVGVFLAAVEYGPDGRRRALRTVLGFAAIALVYQTVNALDRWQRRADFDNDLPSTTLLRLLFSSSTVINSCRYFLFAIVQPFLPWQARTEFVPRAGRLTYYEVLWNGEFQPDALFYLSLAVFGLWASLSMVGWRRLTNAGVKPLTLLGLLTLALAGVHGMVIVAGRMNPRPFPGYLESNGHYTYMTLVFVLLGSGAGLARLAQVCRSSGATWTIKDFGCLALVAGLIVLGAGGAVKARRANRDLSGYFRHFRIGNETLRAFVKEHCKEPAFSFALALSPDDKIEEMCGLPFTIVLYQRYLNATHPQYVVWFEDGRAQAAPAATWLASHPGKRDHLCAEFVRLTSDCAVFQKAGACRKVQLSLVHTFLYKAIESEQVGKAAQ